MNRYRFTVCILSAALLSCSDDRPAPRTVLATSSAPVAGMAHGSHDPKYNGVVMMTGDLHLEVVANHDGYYKVYFSDAARQELPASAVKDLKFGVGRPGFRAEPVEMKINETGENWEGKGGSVSERDVNLLVSFVYQGETRKTDLPFAAAANELKIPSAHP
jgi:hypothetical protein